MTIILTQGEGIPRIINCSEDFPNYLALPRGCYEQVIQILESNGVEVDLVNEYNDGQPIEVMFHGELKDQQVQLVRKDGNHPIVLMQCGPIRYKVDAKAQAKLRNFEHLIIPRHTEFRSG